MLASSLGTLSGCSSTMSNISTKFAETPDVSQSNMTDAISCMGGALKKGQTSSAYVFLVRDINDGTIKNSVYQDSPLADAGRIQMMNVLSEHLQPQVGLVTDTFPLMFSQTNKETVGLNRFGLPSVENQRAFMQSYIGIIQGARQAKKIAPAQHIIPLIVSGSFTRFDKDNLFQKGSGQNTGSRTKRLAENEVDDIYSKPTGQIDIGSTASARAISLVINLVDPRNNLVVSSQALELIFYRKNKTFRLRVGLGEGYYGLAKNEVSVEGVHGAQKTLIDAAALWLLNKAYGAQTNFSSCFSQAQRRVTLSMEKISQIDSASLARQNTLVKNAAKADKSSKKTPQIKGASQ
jgi:hypothetical protein